ncbi:MAG TPA: MBL fold metallo-hydrolase [Steroidobacteraceae bacterium]|nr:MBL fold metallo-hydrolase [Steroidobacteraceae bacterium]
MFRTAKLACLAIAAAATLAACSKTAKEPEPAPTPAPVAEAPAAVAPAADMKSHAFKIGEFSAVALLDGNIELPNDNKVFGVGLTPADVATVLSANNLPTDNLRLSLHPLLVKTADRVLLFDTGAGGLFGPGSGHIADAFADAGVDAATVTDIFISHSHGDHVGGLVNAEGKPAYPNATVHISKAEWKHMQGQDPQKALVAAIKAKVDAFAAGADLIPGVVKAVDIKGHTPGHSGYQITSGAESLLYVGDSMHHSVISVQKPEWSMGFDGDQAVGAASRAALINELAASGQRVYAVHFPFPGVGKMEKRGEGVVWVAE